MKYLPFTNIFLGLGIQSLTLIIVVIGIILIIVVSVWLKEPKESENKAVQKAFHHILRDIGIAFLVAAIVTIAYGSTLDFQRVSDAIGMMVGENVPQSVWDETKTQILGRDVLRGNLKARWEVQLDSALPPDQAVLKVQVTYDLYGLKPQPFNYQIVQELENIHLQNAAGTLPRFDRVTIVGVHSYGSEELKGMVNNGRLTLPPITLNAWKKTDAKSELTENKPVRVIFERSEIINIPGSYTVIMSALTKGAELEIDCPDNIQHELKEWFERGAKGFESAGGKYYTLDGVILPGQSVSVQFWRSDLPSQVPSKSSSDPAKPRNK